MQIPSAFYGRYRDVRPRTQKALMRFHRGLSWREAMEAEGMLQTAESPGMLVLYGPDPSVGGAIHFHLYVPMYLLLTDRTLPPLSSEQEEDVFATSLETPWGLLTMCERQLMYWWFRHADPERRAREGNVERYRRYLRAICRAWGPLDGEGRRYHGMASPSTGEDVWSAASALPHVLARLGVPTGQLTRRGTSIPLPPAGLPGLLTMADRSLAGDLLQALRPGVAHAGHGSPQTGVVAAPFRLMDAMLAHDAELVRQLAARRNPIDAPDVVTETTPLGWAARHGYPDVVSDLLDRGARPDSRCRQDTPLMLAAWGGHRTVVEVLLDRGADPAYHEPFFWDAISYAEDRGHVELAALLRAAQERQVTTKRPEA